jgi:tRNA(Ile)-lysidine synthase
VQVNHPASQSLGTPPVQEGSFFLLSEVHDLENGFRALKLMHKFVRNLITEWRKLDLPFADSAIVVAVSGGADSMSLLLAIEDLVRRKKLDLRITVAHFNHKLRGKESDADQEFVSRLAKDLAFEFVTESGRIAKKGNLEQNARNARYEFLTKVAKRSGASIILTAHTVNDQAETFLMNLIRGSGRE